MIKGVFTALVTPFNEDGSIDIGAYRELIHYQIEQGIDGLVPCGTTGESPTLTADEKDLLIHFDYIHYNPVKHNLTESFDGWKWSSFTSYFAGKTEDSERINPDRFNRYPDSFGE